MATVTGPEADHVVLEHADDVVLAARDQCPDRNLDVALDRNVQRHVGEAAGREEAVRIVEMHLDQHGAGPRLELPGHPRDRADLVALRIGRIADDGAVANLHERHVHLLHVGEDANPGCRPRASSSAWRW